MLNDAGIVANVNTLCTRDRIENAIQQRSCFHAFIKCDTNLANTQILTQIRLCRSYHVMENVIEPHHTHCTRPSSTISGYVPTRR